MTESERAIQELQLLYGIHVYARAKVVPDLMVSRGEEAYRTARIDGNRSVEFLAAGGVALCHLDLGDVAEAERWLGLAANVLSAEPSPLRSRQLETWRGMARSAAGDADGMRRHLEAAVTMATQQGRAAGRCEALARLALEAARLGVQSGDEALLTVASDAAVQAKAALSQLSGHASWGAQADAALASVALARGDIPAAVGAAGAALQAIQEGHPEDAELEVLLPASRAFFAGGPPEAQAQIRDYLQLTLSRIVQGTLDDEMRVRWLRGRVGRELVALAGPIEGSSPEAAPTEAAPAEAASPGAAAVGPQLDDLDRRLLRLLSEGMTNREMAEATGLDEETLAERLAKLLGNLGASSRAEATSLAFRGLSIATAGLAGT